MNNDKKINIGKIILTTIGIAGFVSVALLAPNTLQAFERLFSSRRRKYHLPSYVEKRITHLAHQGMIVFVKKNGRNYVRLTEKGRRALLRYQLGDMHISQPKRWDGKWRAVIFDIKEDRRGLRNELRRELANLGFLRLQHSVWVYPHDCEEIIILLKSYFQTGKDLLYMTIEEIENDKWLKKEFGLP